MATYEELHDLRNDARLRSQVEVAATVKAAEFLDDANATAAEIEFAQKVLENPSRTADQIVYYVLAENKSATVAQIQGASDSTVQTNVDTAIDAFVAGGS